MPTRAPDRVDRRNMATKLRRPASVNRRLYCDVMDKVRSNIAIDLEDLNEGEEFSQGIQAPLRNLPINDPEPFLFQPLPQGAEARHHEHLRARVSGCARQRQAVGPKIPVVGNKIEDLHRRKTVD